MFIIIAMAYWIYGLYFYLNDYFVYIADPDNYTQEMYDTFSNFYYFHATIWPVLSVLAIVACLKLFGVKNASGWTWLFLAIGFGLWMVADWYYSIEWFFNNHNEDIPSVNFARYCYVIGYGLMLAGLVNQLRLSGSKIDRKEGAIIAIIEAVFLTVSIVFVVIPLMSVPVDGVILEEFDQIFLVYYVIFDEVVISLSLLLMFAYRGGQLSWSWFLIAIGFMVVAAYDLMYMYTWYIVQMEYSWYFIEPFYYLMYVVFAIGALHLYINVKTIRA